MVCELQSYVVVQIHSDILRHFCEWNSFYDLFFEDISFPNEDQLLKENISTVGTIFFLVTVNSKRGKKGKERYPDK